MLKKEREEGKLPERSTDMIITLTDGMPNHGELPQFGRLGWIKCFVIFYWAPVPDVFMTVCVCVCVWRSVQHQGDPGRCEVCNRRKHVSLLSWLRKRCGLLVLGRNEQTKQRLGPQNIFGFWCYTSTSGRTKTPVIYSKDVHERLLGLTNRLAPGLLWRGVQPLAPGCGPPLSWQWGGFLNKDPVHPVVQRFRNSGVRPADQQWPWKLLGRSVCQRGKNWTLSFVLWSIPWLKRKKSPI